MATALVALAATGVSPGWLGDLLNSQPNSLSMNQHPEPAPVQAQPEPELARAASTSTISSQRESSTQPSTITRSSTISNTSWAPEIQSTPPEVYPPGWPASTAVAPINTDVDGHHVAAEDSSRGRPPRLPPRYPRPRGNVPVGKEWDTSTGEWADIGSSAASRTAGATTPIGSTASGSGSGAARALSEEATTSQTTIAATTTPAMTAAPSSAATATAAPASSATVTTPTPWAQLQWATPAAPTHVAAPAASVPTSAPHSAPGATGPSQPPGAANDAAAAALDGSDDFSLAKLIARRSAKCLASIGKWNRGNWPMAAAYNATLAYVAPQARARKQRQPPLTVPASAP